MTRLTVLGGSSVATPELVAVLARFPTPSPPLEVMLHGRSPEKLELVGRVCARVAAQREGLAVGWTTDLPRALDRAGIVLLQVRVGGYRARAFDEAFPRELGIPGDETLGPGGFANALRTVPVAVDLGAAIERHAPNAWVLNLTNPSSVVQLALHRTTRLRLIGLCDVPVTMLEGIAGVIGAGPGEVRVDYVGMHHFGWITRVWHQGREVTGEVLARSGELPWIHAPAELVCAMGAIPGPFFDYVLVPEVVLRQQTGRRLRGEELLDLEETLLREYRAYLASDEAGSSAGVGRRRAIWYAKIIGPVIWALIADAGAAQILDLPNHGAVPWLPDDAIVEVPASLGPQGPRPAGRGVAPPDVVALTQHHCACESLLVEAILERSYGKAWRAMALNLMVHGSAQARTLLDRIWPHGGIVL
ncbi:MAG: hypothetical protein FJX73_11520 [Armatimonadetes bacterium]|nr:hypothetical protein [Armatimonadota bacterium]